MSLENYDAQELSDELILQIKNIIDGNQASADEIKQHTYQVQKVSASLYIQWRFHGYSKKTRIAGGCVADNHFAYDLASFERTCQTLYNKACYDIELRQFFLNHQKDIEQKSLVEAEYTHMFHDFGKFSVCQNCATCRGKGKVSCGSCGVRGKIGCHNCGGSGRQSRQEAEYRNGKYAGNRTIYHSCYGCNGSGKCRCRNCSGSGRLRCNNCSGHGFFTLTHHITAVAEPSYNISVSTDYEAKALTKLLSEKGTKFCGEKIPFELVSNEPNNDDTHLFSYEGESVALMQEFSLHDKKYNCCAFSNPPYPYFRPTVFDDLFADELAYLQENIPKTGKTSKRKAIAFFNRYAGQPALDEAMRIIAKTRTETKEVTGSAVFSACHGFISQSMSEKLAGYLNGVMDKVSPTYALSCWWFIGIASVVLAFFSVESRIEYRFLSYPISSIFSSLLNAVSIFAIGITVALIFSVLCVFFARRKVPPEYRQKMRHREPIKLFIKAGILCYSLAVIYGYSAAKNWVPKTRGIPLKIIQLQWDKQKQNVCQSLSKFGWVQARCTIQGSAPKKLSQTDKAKAIQKKLKLSGYHLSVDGKFGKQSVQAANNYLKKQKISLPNRPTVGYYYDTIIKATE